MKPVLDAIYAKFTAANTFNTAIGGRMYLQQAPAGATFPYCVYDQVSNDVGYTFGTEYQEMMFQFAIYDKSTTDAVISPATLLDAQTKLWALYDFCTLSITGYTLTVMERRMNLFRRDTDATILQSLTEYYLRMQKV